eukprot:jgi/Mesvir1/24798/Mv22051-RA.1
MDSGDLERLMFFEQTREQAERDYERDNKDAGALTRWGGALLELAHFRGGAESAAMLEQAVHNFELAISIDPKRHDALWCLGNALTSKGFMYTDAQGANELFAKARTYFKRALDEEPTNEHYRKAHEMSAKAPSLYQELQQQLAQQMASGGGGGMGGGVTAEKKGKESSSFWYDVIGWGVLIGAVVVWLGVSQSRMPPPATK